MVELKQVLINTIIGKREGCFMEKIKKYRGRALDNICFPVGGIGAGMGFDIKVFDQIACEFVRKKISAVIASGAKGQ